mmetsp:Transcript_10187/g.21035  ORF Transcript_10187/g.21035 Transcript_10187/m.21035 type:complete len:149 (-) Transcript_10187:100-546(-)
MDDIRCPKCICLDTCLEASYPISTFPVPSGNMTGLTPVVIVMGQYSILHFGFRDNSSRDPLVDTEGKKEIVVAPRCSPEDKGRQWLLCTSSMADIHTSVQDWMIRCHECIEPHIIPALWFRFHKPSFFLPLRTPQQSHAPGSPRRRVH